jgi:HPt (histidine-containing phosphotransfer) domain-containing protein
MTVKDAYSVLGGDYEGILRRFAKEERIKKFAIKFLTDKSYETLCNSIKNGDCEEAFRAAHTLKGVCQNLSFDRLYESAHEITEALRDKTSIGDNVSGILEKVTEDYNVTVGAIKEIE